MRTPSRLVTSYVGPKRKAPLVKGDMPLKVTGRKKSSSSGGTGQGRWLRHSFLPGNPAAMHVAQMLHAAAPASPIARVGEVSMRGSFVGDSHATAIDHFPAQPACHQHQENGKD